MTVGVKFVMSAGRAVPARDFTMAVAAALDVLDELAEHHDLPAGDWIVTHARIGSVMVTVHAAGREKAEEVFLTGIDQLRRNTQPTGWSPDACRLLSRIPARPGRPVLCATSPTGRRAPSPIDATTKRNARRFITRQASRTSPGSVVGRLDGPQQIRQMKAFMIDRLTGRQVALTYDAELVEEIRATWGELVEITGTVTLNAAGEPRSIHAQQIHRFGARVPFATIFGLLEHDDSFDPAAYLAGVRA